MSHYQFHQQVKEKSAHFLNLLEQVKQHHKITLQPNDQDSIKKIKKINEDMVYREDLGENRNRFKEISES